MSITNIHIGMYYMYGPHYCQLNWLRCSNFCSLLTKCFKIFDDTSCTKYYLLIYNLELIV